MAAAAELNTLRGPDGSASFSSGGISVLASVNGPLEVQRRDELPDEATIEVLIRPAAGVGGVRERHFESIIQKVLRQIIRTKLHPRTLIQVTLQVMATPDQHASAGRPSQASSMLYMLAPLLSASMLALLSTSIPLFTTVTSTILAVEREGSIVADPSIHTLDKACSVHAIAFSSHGALLMVESEGSFDFDTWSAVSQMAELKCRGKGPKNSTEGFSITVTEDPSMAALLRHTVEAKVQTAERWRLTST